MHDKNPTPRNPWLVIPWTFGLFTLAYMNQYLFFWLGARVTGNGFGDLASGEVVTPTTLLLRGLVGLVIGLPWVLLITRFLWRRSWQWMGFAFRPRLLGLGLVIGSAHVAVTLAVMASLGLVSMAGLPTRFSGAELTSTLVGLATWAFFKSVLEELVFRGMATRELARRYNWLTATVVVGLYFGATHLITLGPVLTPGLALGVLVAAVVVSFLFVALYRRACSLWLPIGVHMGWNFMLAGICGLTMSGKGQSWGLFHLELTGSDWLTGGAFGLELSPIAMATTALLAAGIWFGWRRRELE